MRYHFNVSSSAVAFALCLPLHFLLKVLYSSLYHHLKSQKIQPSHSEQLFDSIQHAFISSIVTLVYYRLKTQKRMEQNQRYMDAVKHLNLRCSSAITKIQERATLNY
ncbi:Hypothetical_protein [Hexamita inflata]|uniref:Hypothetical_protein n=1 Tax=Hexamita inflata TaxID=28002 RepID=A0AA86QH18_9EUKA|nr:Hypothetical protein HINF_LOCUS40822 [Hexamita inflata]